MELNMHVSDILGPIDYFSDIENLVSFQRDMIEDYSFKMKWNYSYFSCSYHHFEMHASNIMNSVYIKIMGVRFLSLYLLSN